MAEADLQTQLAIQELEPNANVYEQGLSISRNDVENSSEEISQWLEKVRKE